MYYNRTISTDFEDLLKSGHFLLDYSIRQKTRGSGHFDWT